MQGNNKDKTVMKRISRNAHIHDSSIISTKITTLNL
jgi:hypothetical protein